jgi:hypothetical protein
MDARRRTSASRISCRLGLSLLALPLLMGASHRTTNFVVEAQTAEVAKAVADRAEVCRASISQAWLGEELRAWSRPCPIKVKLTNGEAGGLTSFEFGKGGVTDQVMSVEGRLDRILASAIPHEVTHTVFAAFFGAPMPRWADEGASMLSEDRREHLRQDRIVSVTLERRKDLPLVTLFKLEEYPRDLLGFYGQGYSVSKFLIGMGGRPRYLKFVKDGMGRGWDSAVKAHYGLADVRELDRAWRSWHDVQVELIAQREADGGQDNTVVRAQSAEE